MKPDDKIVTLESYYDPMLAHIIRTRLEANGIPCFIADDNTIASNLFNGQPTGGIKLKVFEHDIEKCREILSSQADLPATDHAEIDGETNTYVICPYCGSNNVSNVAKDSTQGDWPDILNSISNLVNMFQAQSSWHCNNCQQNFE